MDRRRFIMTSKAKAFIGITLSFVVLIVLFTASGGFRSARAAEEAAAKKMDKGCSVAEKVAETPTISQAESK
jgi:hypothetical protein